MSHTVTITRLPDGESDDYEYEFGGTHGFDCEVLHPCKRKACQAMSPEYAPFDERVRHGKLHTHRDGDWLVESDDCALGYVFEQRGPIETFEQAEVTLGTYAVEIRWEDDWWIEIGPRTEQGEAENHG